MANNIYDVLEQVQDMVDVAADVVSQTTETQRILHKNRKYVDPKIATHNADEEAHPFILGRIATMTEDMPSMITPPVVTGPSAVETGEENTWTFAASGVIATVHILSFEVTTSDGDVIEVPAVNDEATFTYTFTGNRNEQKFFGVKAKGSYDYISKITQHDLLITHHLPPSFTDFTHTIPAVINHGDSYTFRISGISDPDDDLTRIDLTYDSSKISLSADTDISQDTDITLTCGNVQGGTTSITITATDARELTNSTTITMRVNTDPNVSGLTHTYPNHLNPNASILARVGGVTDIDNDTVTYSIASSIPEITFSKSTGIALNEDITVAVGNLAATTAYTLTLTFTDEYGGTNTSTITGTINTPPDLTNFVAAVAERVAINTNNNTISFSGVSDAESSPILYSITNPNSVLSFSKMAGIAPNESVTFAVSSSATRGQTYPITVTATDEDGATASTTVNIVTNSLPVVTDVVTTLPDIVAPDTDYSVSFSGATDIDGQTLTYTPSSTQANTNSASALAANATFTLHTPTEAEVARGETWTLTVTVSDGLETVDKTFTITQNVLPVVTNLEATTSVTRLVVGETATITFGGATD